MKSNTPLLTTHVVALRLKVRHHIFVTVESSKTISGTDFTVHLAKPLPSLQKIPVYVAVVHTFQYGSMVNIQRKKILSLTQRRAPFWLPKGCGDSYDIKVVKCPGNFYLYKLKKPKRCDLAYCGKGTFNVIVDQHLKPAAHESNLRS